MSDQVGFLAVTAHNYFLDPGAGCFHPVVAQIMHPELLILEIL